MAHSYRPNEEDRVEHGKGVVPLPGGAYTFITEPNPTLPVTSGNYIITDGFNISPTVPDPTGPATIIFINLTGDGMTIMIDSVSEANPTQEGQYAYLEFKAFPSDTGWRWITTGRVGGV